MKNSQRGLVDLLVVILLGLVAIGGTSYLLYKAQQVTSAEPNTSSASITTSNKTTEDRSATTTISTTETVLDHGTVEDQLPSDDIIISRVAEFLGTNNSPVKFIKDAQGNYVTSLTGPGNGQYYSI